MDLFYILVSIIVTLDISVCNAVETQAEILKGVTIKNWPYADRLSGKYEGYVVDLMNEIADIVGFEYRLYFSPDGSYGTVRDNRVNGMIGEVYTGRADFAVADITVTDARKKFVDFTEPFMENSVAVLLHKRNAKNIRSFNDLVNSDLKYGTYRMGSTYQLFSQSNDPTLKRMYSHMERHPEVLVNNAKEGVDKVNATAFGFLVESTFAEFLSGMYCDLTFVVDDKHYFPRQYSIAMPKDSTYTSKFNYAIRRLKQNRQLDRIKARYWKDRCEDNTRDPNGNHNNKNTDRSNNIVEDKRRTTIRLADKAYDVSATVDKTLNYSIVFVFAFLICQTIVSYFH